ncbi:MAG: putative monovalent cation/H+ antiporter subunit A [Terrimicrobiaceae bacterium]|nr:putative monovalent cation/H+ antiporter subunit A [Terrimicrobiaceae bacterium]
MGLLHWIALIFAGGFAAPFLHRRLGDRTGFLLAVLPFGAFVHFCTLVPAVAAGGSLRWEFPWAPSLGISLSFFVDGLSLLFLLVISLVGTFIVLYAAGYLHGKTTLGRFYLALLLFMGSMLGLVASDNIILLFIFWELTSISSFLLIGYYHEQESSRASALQALLVTGAGGLAMLAGLILLGNAAGTYEISRMLAMPAGTISALPGFLPIFILVLLGAFTKSAQFPFHFWLPNAMAAPAPVSAFLHSATMVKAGVFLLARLHPAFGDYALWTPVVGSVGAVTMLTGVFLAMHQSDLKRILAYTTLAVLGTLTMLLGIGTELAIKACMTYLLAHALYKAALFMTSGTIDHETGTRDVAVLSGLGSKMPFTATAALIGALSMAGIPLLIGFVSKEYFYKALLDAPGPGVLWEVIGVGASVLMGALAIVTGIRPFFGRFRETPKHAHEGPWTMWIGPIILGAAALKFGIFPGWVGTHLIGPAAGSILGEPAFEANLKLWHGFNTALFLSILTVVLAVGVYLIAPRWRSASQPLYKGLASVGPESAYGRILDGILVVARWQTGILQNGKLRNYVLTVGGFLVLLVIWVLPKNPVVLDFDRMIPPSILGVTVCVLMIIAAVATCFVQSRFTAILTLGVVGLGVAVLFFLFSAPDLAMTQILVETLTVVLFVLAFYRLPLLREFSSRAVKIRDALLAAGFGLVMTMLVLIAFHFETIATPISEYMSANSLPMANGRNVVNVILVDFRALDTLGEITVLAIAALGVFAMLKLRPNKP